ncbi:type II toxin-antitoxin system ParD family antitoxin [Nocardia sp. FBN12]|uniref:type II toxin-antitoxin system ParD family antitoxin n=1 Tax=Nocardia sp. FBN12 TaxID=3419766 RepID=UPI003D078E8B
MTSSERLAAAIGRLGLWRGTRKLEALRAAVAAGEVSGPSTELDFDRRIEEVKGLNVATQDLPAP